MAEDKRLKSVYITTPMLVLETLRLYLLICYGDFWRCTILQWIKLHQFPYVDDNLCNSVLG